VGGRFDVSGRPVPQRVFTQVGLQPTNEDVVIDAAESGAQVQKTEQRDVLTFGSGVDVGQDAQKRGLCRMMAPVCRLQSR